VLDKGQSGYKSLAIRAAELIDIDYTPLSAVTETLSAMSPESPLLYEDWDDNVQAHRIFTGFGKTANVIVEAAKIAAKTVQPRSSFRADAEYRKDMAQVLTKRVLTAGLAMC